MLCRSDWQVRVNHRPFYLAPPLMGQLTSQVVLLSRPDDEEVRSEYDQEAEKPLRS